MKHPPPPGMTLLEVTLVSGLMALLAVLLSAAWSGVGRPTMDLIIRTRVLREMAAAADALSRDLGGYLPDPAARLGDIRQYRWVGWKTAEGELQLCYDGDNEPDRQPNWTTPDTVIIYRQDGENLLRTDQTNDKTTYIARYLTEFEASEDAGYIRLYMKFNHRGFQRECTLFIREPQ